MKDSRRRRKMSVQKYYRRKLLKEECDHDKFMNYNLDQKNQSMHPLAVLTYSDFKKLKDNLIVVENPVIFCGKSIHRKIYYSVKSVGKNIKFDNTESTMNIQLRQMKKRFFMIVIEKKSLELIDHVSTINYDHAINMSREFRRKSEKYLILMMCGDFSSSPNENLEKISKEDLLNVENVIPNQICSKEKHFGSGGKVFSTGYSAKYKVSEGKSFELFVKSEYYILSRNSEIY